MSNTIAMENNGQIASGIVFMTILGALMAFTSLSTDIYLPAMPAMAEELNGNAELTITGFLIGFTFAQLLWGPISDSIGRKIPLYIGMLVFAVGAAGCAMSHSIEQIVFWRIFQAFGPDRIVAVWKRHYILRSACFVQQGNSMDNDMDNASVYLRSVSYRRW